MATPIWKDYFVELGIDEYLDYTIEIDGSQVFAARAYSRTGAPDFLTAKINDVVADYFTRAVPLFYSDSPIALTPNVTAVVKVAGVTKATLEFTPDWSYNYDMLSDYDTARAAAGICIPVDGWIVQGQHLLFSYLGPTATPVLRITYLGERGDFQPWLSPGEGSFSRDFFVSGWWQDINLVTYSGSGARVYSINLSEYSDIYKVEIGSKVGDIFTPIKTWRVWNGCCRYVLHYMNAYGGWDSLLIRGNGMQTDTLKRYTRKVQYHNSTITNRGTENYVNEMGAKYILHTGIMTDEQSSRMHHLLNSPEVYLEDMKNGNIFPVVLTNTTSEHKTWPNQGHKLIEYTIEAELAQERIRR